MPKKIGEESHVYNAKGELEGLYTIDGAEARKVFGNKKFWQGVDEIIRLYQKINPSEYQYTVTENAITKHDNKNSFGSNSDNTFRQALSIPYGLYLALIDYEPTIFRDKKMRTSFMKRYPLLRTCEKV